MRTSPKIGVLDPFTWRASKKRVAFQLLGADFFLRRLDLFIKRLRPPQTAVPNSSAFRKDGGSVGFNFVGHGFTEEEARKCDGLLDIFELVIRSDGRWWAHAA